jgi:hypothetical protein
VRKPTPPGGEKRHDLGLVQLFFDLAHEAFYQFKALCVSFGAVFLWQATSSAEGAFDGVQVLADRPEALVDARKAFYFRDALWKPLDSGAQTFVGVPGAGHQAPLICAKVGRDAGSGLMELC